MFTGQQLILFSLALCCCAFSCLFGNRPKLSSFCITAGLAASLYAFLLRYFHSFPMIPMYVGLHGTTCILLLIWLFLLPGLSPKSLEKRILLVIIILFSIALLFFPKDFYLPILRSITVWSHIFLLTGIVAKGFFLTAAVLGIGVLKGNRHEGIAAPTQWGIWGVVFLSISIFSGECWSYLGWGTPVVWHDPAITFTTALWFYWIAFLHLHHSGRWKPRSRALFLAMGGVLVLFSSWPDLGPFRPLFLELL